MSELTPEQRQNEHLQAAWWDERAEIALRAYNYAREQREKCLERLGMLKRAGQATLYVVKQEDDS